jgi:hypothetical protein
MAEPSTVIFGRRWDAPRADTAVLVVTPIGQECLHCGEPIIDGECGLVMPWIASDGAATMGAAHIEGRSLRSLEGPKGHGHDPEI